MATQIKNIVRLVNLAPGATQTIAHGLNWNGIAVKPDICTPSDGNFTFVSADETNITFRNDGVAATSCDVLCESWHTIERAFGAATVASLSPAPFVPGGGGGGTDAAVLKAVSGGLGGLASSQTIVFGNSNGVSFGADGTSIVTAQFDALKTVIAHGGVTASGPSISFADGNGVTFGLVGNTITASVQTVGGTATGVGISAGTQTAGTGAVVFSNSNNISFGMNASTVTASYAGIKSISGGTTRVTNGEVVYSNSNNVSFGVAGNTVTASAYAPAASRLVGFTATGGETQLTVTFAPALTFSTYSVIPFNNGVASIIAWDAPAQSRSVSQFVAIPTGALVSGDQIGFQLTAS